MLAFADAVSASDNFETALQEVVDSLADRATDAHLVFVFFSAAWADQAENIASAFEHRFPQAAVIGCTAESVIGRGQEIEERNAITAWAAQLPGCQVLPMRLWLEQTGDGAAVLGWHDQLEDNWPDDATLFVLGDPFSFPVDLVLERLNADRAGVPVIGGMASGGSGPGQSRLMGQGRTHDDGAVAVLVAGSVVIDALVSQGCRPIGSPLVVTRAEKNVIHELGGRAALLQLKEIFDTLPNHERELVQKGLHLGRVVSEYQDRFEQGDFLIRNVMGIQPDDGSIVVADWIRVGQTVQFQLRDAETADVELKQLLARRQPDAVEAALIFSCNGRGSRLFPEPHHDVQAIHQALGEIPAAGFFAAGEIGPVGDQNFVHGFTASIALWRSK